MTIKREVFNSMITHAKKDSPVESCGYLAARGQAVIKHYELTNIDKSSRHFSFEPREQFNVLKDIKAKGLRAYAVYHSHSNTKAFPSSEDVKLSNGVGVFHVIVSLAGEKPDIKAFKIIGGEIKSELIEIN